MLHRTSNAHSRVTPGLLRSVATASKPKIAVARSPEAAGRANVAGKSGESTPGIKKAKPTNRNKSKTRIGRSASTRDNESPGEEDENFTVS